MCMTSLFLQANLYRSVHIIIAKIFYAFNLVNQTCDFNNGCHWDSALAKEIDFNNLAHYVVMWCFILIGNYACWCMDYNTVNF